MFTEEVSSDLIIVESNHENIQATENELLSSLRYAAVLQSGIFPKKRHFNRIFKDSFVLNKPQQIVSGDFFWIAEQDDLIYIAVGDCTGHGVPAAMLSIMAHNLLGYAILNKKIKKTHKILKELDKRFIECFSSSNQEEAFDNDWVDISLCCIDRKKKLIYFSSANRKGLLVNSNGFEVLFGSSYPIGGWQVEKERNFESTAISYESGDALYIGSDGFQDQIGGPHDKKYKSINLHKLLSGIYAESMERQKELLEEEFYTWKGRNMQIDDICIVGIRL